MTDLVVSRSPRDLENGKMSWIVYADQRGLAVSECDCGLPVLGRRVWLHHAVIVTLEHENGLRCDAAFDLKDFHPLKYREYCNLLGMDSDYEDDEVK